ncbi:unnamed protein product [Acanthoscelides obtectus]|uniref:Uncharacterized protein n=1 Tax=Acanthoscelides obtectus TaxID=200917 RepID=A0A9P0VTB3_ACAOB|nr:unnamed protein product [Acanthoscelides obtectus]CAK1659868.1 Molybdenum cofactor sulfurase [Acanthoscelides obtectus]
MEEFLKFNSVYTDQYHKIAKEFKRIGENIYLDHAGATLYSEKQMQHVSRNSPPIFMTILIL